MNKIYYVRHQAHGVVHEFPFRASPTQNQIEAVRKYCFNIHGFGHMKTPGEPYWVKVVEVPLLGDEVPEVPDRDMSESGVPGVALSSAEHIGTKGTGLITPSKGR